MLSKGIADSPWMHNPSFEGSVGGGESFRFGLELPVFRLLTVTRSDFHLDQNSLEGRSREPLHL